MYSLPLNTYPSPSPAQLHYHYSSFLTTVPSVLLLSLMFFHIFSGFYSLAIGAHHDATAGRSLLRTPELPQSTSSTIGLIVGDAASRLRCIEARALCIPLTTPLCQSCMLDFVDLRSVIVQFGIQSTLCMLLSPFAVLFYLRFRRHLYCLV